MSYCRFGWDGSDVYVFMSVDGHLECCGCILDFNGNWKYDSTEAMIAHLEEHKKAGHTVPDDVIPQLRADDAENFPKEAKT